jgi:TRAP-type C4-dicarboxylate transport system permease small subunit
LRAESAGFIVSILCFVFSIYLAGLSLQIADASLRVQLVAIATSFFVAGIVVVISLIILLAFRRLFKA